MMFPAVAVTMLSLLSVGLSAPVIDCKNLTRPIEIENREQLLGKWTALAESTNMPGSQQLTKLLVGNSWVNVNVTNDVDVLEFVQYQKLMGACYSIRVNMTLANNTLSSGTPLMMRDTLLSTSCPDCLVVYAESPTTSSVLTGLQFLSKRRTVTDAEMEEFKKQVQCLGLPAPAVLNTETALCPEDSQSQETQTTDLTDTFKTMGDDIMRAMDEFLTSGSGIKDLIKLISSNVFEKN
ncbi:uncharacterized protein LOC142891743 [Nelusetta ayraudi]|uniref:uncharacterized protein LOC142891743 n=1 Tax=Nelusetta ayraudi TaxID=303726 RepID=UPI003F7269F5